MLSDLEDNTFKISVPIITNEEIEALRNFKSEYESCDHYSSDLIIELDDAEILLNLIKKQSKEIEELSDKLTEKICKGVEEEILEEYRQTIISKDKEIEGLKAISEYREKIIKGLGLKTLPKTITGFKELLENNDKKWEDKIKAKIEELGKLDFGTDLVSQFTANLTTITILQSLLEKK